MVRQSVSLQDHIRETEVLSCQIDLGAGLYTCPLSRMSRALEAAALAALQQATRGRTSFVNGPSSPLLGKTRLDLSRTPDHVWPRRMTNGGAHDPCTPWAPHNIPGEPAKFPTPSMTGLRIFLLGTKGLGRAIASFFPIIPPAKPLSPRPHRTPSLEPFLVCDRNGASLPNSS